jgi:hypothetical protein
MSRSAVRVRSSALSMLMNAVEKRPDYSVAAMISMMIVTVVPLAAAALGCFLIPCRSRQTPEAPL